MKTLPRLLFGVSLVAALWAMACGDDPPEEKSTDLTLAVRSGTWHLTGTTTFSGADSCVARGQVDFDTLDVLCDAGGVTGGEEFPLFCTDLDTVGPEVSFDCRIPIDLGICTLTIFLSGEGTVTDSLFDMDLVVVQRLTAKDPDDADDCETFFGESVDPCTTLVSSHGEWVNAKPTCIINGPVTVSSSATDTVTYTSSVDADTPVSYHWSVTGRGASITTSTTASSVDVRVTTAAVDSIRLTLNLDDAGCQHCTKKVVITKTSSAGTGALSRETGTGAEPAAAPPEPGSETASIPLSDFLRRIVGTYLREHVAYAP